MPFERLKKKLGLRSREEKARKLGSNPNSTTSSRTAISKVPLSGVISATSASQVAKSTPNLSGEVSQHVDQPDRGTAARPSELTATRSTESKPTTQLPKETGADQSRDEFRRNEAALIPADKIEGEIDNGSPENNSQSTRELVPSCSLDGADTQLVPKLPPQSLTTLLSQRPSMTYGAVLLIPSVKTTRSSQRSIYMSDNIPSIGYSPLPLIVSRSYHEKYPKSSTLPTRRMNLYKSI